MKRISSIVIACSLLVPAAATARKTESRGLAAGEPGVSFNAKIKDDEVVKVTKFTFVNIVLQCNEGQLTVDNERSPLPAMKVKDDEFGDRFTSNDGQKVSVSGEFRKKGTQASGILRVRGDFSASDGTSRTDCDSGKVKWEAGS